MVRGPESRSNDIFEVRKYFISTNSKFGGLSQLLLTNSPSGMKILPHNEMC